MSNVQRNHVAPHGIIMGTFNYTHDPLYQWYGQQIKDLTAEMERLNRRDPKKHELQGAIKNLKELRALMRDAAPAHVDYGLF